MLPTSAFSRAAAAFILLLAVTANVSYLGHWGGDVGEHAHLHSLADVQEHADHCHLSPAKCSGQQSLVGTLWIGDASRLVDFKSALLLINLAEVQAVLEVPAAPLSPPPRAA